MASYIAVSPCGWNFPITSPTTRADFLNASSGANRNCRMANSKRRCTGLSPSRTSGNDLDIIVESA